MTLQNTEELAPNTDLSETPKILCQIDVMARESEYTTLLKAMFQKLGAADFKLIFGSPTWKDGRSTFFDVIKESADLLVVNTHHARRTAYNLPWKRASNARMVIWHTEQLMNELSFPDRMNLGFQDDFNRDVERHIVWGPRFARALIQHANVDPSRIYIAGCPKLDLVRDPFFHREPNTTGRKQAVFVGGFLWAHYDDAEYATALRRYRFDPTSGYREFFQPAYARFMETVRRIAPRHPEIDIVVRPHPREPRSAYEELLKFSNVRIEADTPFRTVLREADVIFQWHSTSFFESVASGVPVYNLNLNPEFKRHWRDYFDVYRWVDPELVVETFGDIVNAPAEMPPNVRDGMEDIFSQSHGAALPRTMNALLHILAHVEKPAWTTRDHRRANAALFTHRLKDLLGAASAAAETIGVRNRFTRRVFEAQKAYENGPDYLEQSNVVRLTDRWHAERADYLEEAVSSEASFDLTDVGWVVTCR